MLTHPLTNVVTVHLVKCQTRQTIDVHTQVHVVSTRFVESNQGAMHVKIAHLDKVQILHRLPVLHQDHLAHNVPSITMQHLTHALHAILAR